MTHSKIRSLPFAAVGDGMTLCHFADREAIAAGFST